jgi:hypothetical protein
MPADRQRAVGTMPLVDEVGVGLEASKEQQHVVETPPRVP